MPARSTANALFQGVEAGQAAKANALAIQGQEAENKITATQRLSQAVLSDPDPAAAYPVIMKQAQQMGLDVDGMPEAWGPEAEAAMMIVANATPEELTEFERLIQGFGADEQDEARRIKLGLAPDANTTARVNKPSSPLVTIQNSNTPAVSPTAFSETVGKRYGEMFASITDTAANANVQLNALSEAKRVISDPELYMGTGAEFVLAGKKALQSLGFDVSGVTTGEELIALTNKQALAALGDLKGVASDTDMRVIMDTTAGLSDTREGALARIEIAERAALYSIAVSQRAEQYVSTHGQLDEGWIRERNMMSEAFREQILGDLRNSPAWSGYDENEILGLYDSLKQQGKSEDEIKKIFGEMGFDL